MDKLEYVSRALCHAEGFNPDHFGIKADENGVHENYRWMDYRDLAKTAIIALNSYKHPEYDNPTLQAMHEAMEPRTQHTVIIQSRLHEADESGELLSGGDFPVLKLDPTKK